jgi:hypothetical protein
MMGRGLVRSCAVSALLLCLSAGSLAAEPAGVVKRTQGEASIHRSGTVITPTPGMKVFPGDGIRTGRDGTLGIIFRDDSILSLGHDSAVDLDDFVFAPAEGRMGIVARIARGTIAYLSGLIGKLSPESVHFETPEASIGIRGTHFAVQVQPEP